MKKLLVVLILGSVSRVLSWGYDPVTVYNSTPFMITAHIKYACLNPDDITIQPYSTGTASSNRGICLVKDVYADVTETAAGLQQLGFGALQASRGTVATSHYKSSGTSYSKFMVTGPYIDPATEQRAYVTSRLVQ